MIADIRTKKSNFAPCTAFIQKNDVQEDWF